MEIVFWSKGRSDEWVFIPSNPHVNNIVLFRTSGFSDANKWETWINVLAPACLAHLASILAPSLWTSLKVKFLVSNSRPIMLMTISECFTAFITLSSSCKWNSVNRTCKFIFLDIWIVPHEATFFTKSSHEYLWLDFKKVGAKWKIWILSFQGYVQNFCSCSGLVTALG